MKLQKFYNYNIYFFHKNIYNANSLVSILESYEKKEFIIIDIGICTDFPNIWRQFCSRWCGRFSYLFINFVDNEVLIPILQYWCKFGGKWFEGRRI